VTAAEFNRDHWIGGSSFVLDCLLTSDLGRATLAELCLLEHTEELARRFHTQHEAALAVARGLVA
jgi:hypothetical protein